MAKLLYLSEQINTQHAEPQQCVGDINNAGKSCDCSFCAWRAHTHEQPESVLFQKLFPLTLRAYIINLSALSASRGWNNSRHRIYPAHHSAAGAFGVAFSAPLLEIFLFTHKNICLRSLPAVLTEMISDAGCADTHANAQNRIIYFYFVKPI